MNSSTFFIYANLFAGYAVAVLGFGNLIWLAEMTVNAFIQRKELNEYLKFGWKSTLIWAWGLGILGIGIVYLPALGSDNPVVSALGIGIYLISIAAFLIQTYFVWDCRRNMKYYVEQSWYVTSFLISEIISTAAAVSVLIYLITVYAVTGF